MNFLSIGTGANAFMAIDEVFPAPIDVLCDFKLILESIELA